MDQVTQIKTQLRMEQWKQLIEECQKSEMSVSAWCKENNVSESSYPSVCYIPHIRLNAHTL